MAGTPDLTATLRARFEQLVGEYERLDAQVGEARRKLQDVRGTAASADGGIRVTVGPRGALVGLEVDPRTYRRLSPAELTEQILDVAHQATEEAVRQAEEVLRPLLPEGVPLRGILDGSAALHGQRRPVGVEAFDRWRSAMGLLDQDERPRRDDVPGHGG